MVATGCTNTPPSEWCNKDWSTLHVIPADRRCTQIYITANGASSATDGLVQHIAIRWFNYMTNAFDPWMVINPSMVVGVEYRTTERYRGKSVYCKTVNFGALPNASYKFVGIENGASIIRASGLASNGKTLPGSIGASQREQVLCMGSGNSVEIITYADASSLTATVTAWYTKTTD